MENKLPFYMAYPVPLLYNDDRNARRDYDYMKKHLPGYGEESTSLYGRGM